MSFYSPFSPPLDFDPNFRFYLPKHVRIFERNKLLVQHCTDKSVLHIGCCDHEPLIRKRFDNDTLLHKQLSFASSTLFGLDTNKSGLDILAGLGFNHLFTPDTLPSANFDLVIVPDVIEHVFDIGVFLDWLKSIDCQNFIFTTPNAFRLFNRYALNSYLINSDHLFWFSPFTLMSLLHRSGFTIDELQMTDTLTKKRPIRFYLKNKFPLLADGMFVRCSLR